MTTGTRERRGRRRRSRDERSQVTVLIVGFAAIVLLLIGVVVDATAAYVQRQGLDSLADGAALHGSDLGATGRDVYTGGVTDAPLEITRARARTAVADYLASVGAHRRYPGLRYEVSVVGGAQRVVVRLRAPVDLPLAIPGSPGSASVAATGSSSVVPD